MVLVLVILGMILVIVNWLVVDLNDEVIGVKVGVREEEEIDKEGFLVVSMFVYLDNIVMCKWVLV